MTSSRARALAATACLIFSGGIGAAELRVFEAVEPHMGTLFRITLYAHSEGEAKAACHAAFARVAELDNALSDYKPDSELNRICKEAAGRPVAVSPGLLAVLAASQKLAEETGGAFDVTLGPVTRLWRRARAEGRPPEADALREAASRTGYRKLHLDAARGTVLLDQAGMQLDVGGIGKGFAADEVLQVLAGLGIRRALVAASGDLAFGDPPPGKKGWRIGVDEAGRPDAEFTRVLELSNAAVSTSGEAEQNLESAGRKYSHIIDPATSMGLTRAITVTVVARRGLDADALSTALSVMGPRRGMAYIETRVDAAAMMMVSGKVVESTRWGSFGQ